MMSDEGIFVGLSSGATLAAGLRVAETADDGSVILVMLPDTGERYLSTYLFAPLCIVGGLVSLMVVAQACESSQASSAKLHRLEVGWRRL